MAAVKSKAGKAAPEAAKALRQQEETLRPFQPAAGGTASGLEVVSRLQGEAGNQATGNLLASLGGAWPRDGGRPLDAGLRSLMESRFSRDFSGVRVHDDPPSARMADLAQAEAFTVGAHIAFANGRFDPGSPSGLRLLSHELAHVVQQSRGGPAALPEAGSGLERAADSAAQRVESGSGPVAVSGAASPGLSRQPKPGEGFKLGGELTLKLNLTLGTLSGFLHNSPDLTPEQQARIPDIAQTIQMLLVRMPFANVKLYGHTDLTGGEDYNLGLGEKRGNAVREALIKAGVPAANLKVESRGEREPAVATEEKEPANRRVEVRFEADSSSLGPLEKGVPKPGGLPGGLGPGGVTGGGIGGGGIGGGGTPPVGGLGQTIPPAIKQPTLKERLKERVEADPIVKSLRDLLKDNKITKKAYDAAVDGLTDAIYRADETVAEKALDFLPVDDKVKAALKAAAKALLRTAKGEKWVPPQPPLYEPPPSGAPKYEPAPGETIFKLPPIPFNWP